MLKLHDYYRSTACYRVRIALHLKKLNFETLTCDLVKDGGTQHTSEFKRLNPQGLVPALEDTEHDIILAQSLAILEYLDEQYPIPSLLPTSPVLRAQARRIANIIACDMHPLNNLRVLKYLTNTLSQTEEIKIEWYHHWLKCGFDAIESLLISTGLIGDFCIGNQVTLADICLVPQVYNARRFEFSMNDYPNIVKIEERCLNMSAFDKATPENCME